MRCFFFSCFSCLQMIRSLLIILEFTDFFLLLLLLFSQFLFTLEPPRVNLNLFPELLKLPVFPCFSFNHLCLLLFSVWWYCLHDCIAVVSFSTSLSISFLVSSAIDLKDLLNISMGPLGRSFSVFCFFSMWISHSFFLFWMYFKYSC